MNVIRRILGEESREDESAGYISYLLHAIHSLLLSRFAPHTETLAGKPPARVPLGWNDPRIGLGAESRSKPGSFQPNTVVCPHPNGVLRSAQVLLVGTLLEVEK